MSNLLKKKHPLASLRVKLEEKQERECWKYRGLGHRAQHCRKEEKEKGKPIHQDKFEILASRVMTSVVKRDISVGNIHCGRRERERSGTLKGTKGTISLAQAKDAVPGPNCMVKSLWG